MKIFLTSWSQKITQKLWPEPTALAFQDFRPGQSCGQAMTLAQLSLKPGHAYHYTGTRSPFPSIPKKCSEDSDLDQDNIVD